MGTLPPSLTRWPRETFDGGPEGRIRATSGISRNADRRHTPTPVVCGFLLTFAVRQSAPRLNHRRSFMGWDSLRPDFGAALGTSAPRLTSTWNSLYSSGERTSYSVRVAAAATRETNKKKDGFVGVRKRVDTSRSPAAGPQNC